MELLVLLASSDEVPHVLPMDDVTAWKQVLEVSSKPTSITMDDIHEAQSVDNNLQPVVQALKDLMNPLHGRLRDYPKRLVSSSLSGIRLSSRMASCTVATTFLTALLSICKSCCQPNCDDHMSSVFTLTLDTSEGRRRMAFARCAYFPGCTSTGCQPSSRSAVLEDW